MGEDSIWLNVRTSSLLPKWFMNFPKMGLAEALDNWHILRTAKLSAVKNEDLIDLKVDGVQLQVSTVELAAYELLEEVSAHISFTHAAQIFQGLVNLSPRKVQSLLERSNAVQTNRIFLFLGNYYKHQWIKKIDVSKINLGSGKRHVVSNGKLAKQYSITVPEEFISSDLE
jgi:hypothetical protein